MTTDKERVRALNDALRREHKGGTILLTAGILALDVRTIRRVDEAIAGFTAFDADNDPYEEHDFGSVSVDGETVFFKIDCYDLDHRCHSPNPADPAVTRRVLTIMLAEEY